VLEARISEKFAKSKAGGGKFQVKVKGGVAYLSGRADVVQHKGSATRMAKAAGAPKVVNNIVVSEAAKQRARRNLEQGRSQGGQTPKGEEKPRTATVRPAA
jgi:hypothetical protein